MKNRFLLCMAVAIKIVLLRAFYLFAFFAIPVVVIASCILLAAAWVWVKVLAVIMPRGLIHDWPDAIKGLFGYGRLPRKQKSRY